jgi:hypothetical protein
LPWHKVETDKIAETIDQRQNLRAQPATALVDCLIFCPPFAPWPWR